LRLELEGGLPLFTQLPTRSLLGNLGEERNTGMT
jgi:hypothetical protein